MGDWRAGLPTGFLTSNPNKKELLGRIGEETARRSRDPKQWVGRFYIGAVDTRPRGFLVRENGGLEPRVEESESSGGVPEGRCSPGEGAESGEERERAGGGRERSRGGRVVLGIDARPDF